MKITHVETLQAQMVELDDDVRFLRIVTPGAGANYNWFRPLGDADALEFRFVLLGMADNLTLENLFKNHIGVTQ